MALVIKHWSASRTPDASGNYVHLVGREAGLFAWLLSLLGIDPTTEIEIKDKLIVFTAGSLSGKQKRVIPMQSVCSAYYGYIKPWQMAVVLGVLLLPFFFVGLLVGPLYYFLNKELTVGVVENSGWSGGFAFKRSVIEGQNIDESKAYEVIDIIRSLIEARTA
ncbi:MAG: hypothetical protein U1E77_18850 [Inhella sp.]